MGQSYPVTPEGFADLTATLHELKTKERPKVIRAIEEARGHGDLSENAEYDAAKDRQGLLEARINDLENRVANSLVIDPKTLTEDKVVFGATVTVVNIDTDEEKTYMIVGDHEANIRQSRISISSPLARVLIGKKEGDIVDFETPAGLRELEITKIEYK